MENELQRISLDPDTGSVTGLFAVPGNRDYLTHQKGYMPFTIWRGFSNPYQFTAEKAGSAFVTPPNPEDIADAVFKPSHGPGISHSDRRVIVEYRDEQSPLTACLSIEMEGPQSRWSLSITNTGRESIEILPEFPVWKNLNLSRKAGGRMLVMNQAGYVGSLWSHAGGLYGHAFQQSSQFGCLFERETGDCFGFYVDDPAFGAKEIKFAEPSIAVRWIPTQIIEPGAGITLPSSVLMLYNGSWKATAVAYGEWFAENIDPDPVPEWIRHNESYTGAWAERRGDEYETRPGGDDPDMPSGAMESFDELPVHFHRIPAETIEFAFYCRQSQHPANNEHGEPLGPQPRRHTDGWNAIREDLGGMPSLRRGIDAVHAEGGRVTLYVEGLIVPDDSELFTHIPEARDWILHNPDGENDGPYTEERFVHMCPGCVEWQDHVVDMCTRLMTESAADGIRLDSLGFYYWPCYNPAHHHASPFDYNMWVQKLYEKVAKAVRSIKPDALLSTEAPADFNHRHFNHSLHQIFSMELPGALGEEPSPLRVALPSYRLHSGAGVAGAPLQVQPLWHPPDADDAPWLSAFSEVRETFCDGDVSPSDPVAIPDDLYCRRIRGVDEDIITGVRPASNDDKTVSANLLPQEIRRETRLVCPIDYEPRTAWLFDLQGNTLDPLNWIYDDGMVSFSTDSNWFMALLCRIEGPSPIWITTPETIKRGGKLDVEISAPGITGTVNGCLRAPGLFQDQSLDVRIPGTTSIDISPNTRPGWYRLVASGDDVRPSVRLLRVTS